MPAAQKSPRKSARKSAQKSAQWSQRRLAGLAVRVVTVVVPFAAAVGVIVGLGHAWAKPSGASRVGWYATICVTGWLVSWAVHHVLQRLLPLALLLEMSLAFPERAPSRLRLARRAASNRDLEDLVAGRADAHETTQQAAERILALVTALGRHDRRTRGHSERVRAFTDLIGVRLGLTAGDRDRLRWAALLHDIGKLRIPQRILNKPGSLNAAEWHLMYQHPELGHDIAAPLREWLGPWSDVIVQHHERWDGRGYPRGLAGTAICLGARIVSVADAYDVMTAARAYKKAVGRIAALREIVECSGGQFDPTVVRAILSTPRRHLMLAMGPMSWLVGLPLIGQANAALSAAAIAPGAAAGAAAAGAVVTAGAAFAPVALTPAPQPAQPVTTTVAVSHTHASVADATKRRSVKPSATRKPASRKSVSPAHVQPTHTPAKAKAKAQPTRTHTPTHAPTHAPDAHPHTSGPTHN